VSETETACPFSNIFETHPPIWQSHPPRSRRATINQEEAAERCGLHRTYYSGVERGVRNVVGEYRTYF
jgi:hypothetical protein